MDTKKLLKHVPWAILGIIGAFCLAVVALRRGEHVSALWIVVASVSVYLVAYRYYSLYIAQKVMKLDPTRATPAVINNDGLNYVPTNRYVLFGHHFAAIAGAGPLVGPVLAAQIESLGCKYLIKAKSYSTLTSQATNSSIVFVKGEEGRETTELYTKLVKWEKDRRFVVSRVLKPEKERAQLSLLEGSEYDYFFFVTNTTLLSEKVVIYYEKRGNAENYIKEAKYDMAVGHLLLKSFWANEAVFQMMMLSYNLFLLFKFDSLDSSEYRQQIKTFRLKYVFLAAKIIKTARYVIMKLSENYPYKGVYEKCLV
ncbi:carbon starvation CstA family protein [Enterobacter hormaechei]|uniref:carbon starvation CstA family protein n=1 Tax=Enterobacter hormaechei TaxID=158836 RepID=UPI003D366955